MTRSIANLVVSAGILAFSAAPSYAQLVRYDPNRPVTKTIDHTYDWQQNPYSRVNSFCSDRYFFYDPNHDGKMDQVSIVLSPSGHGKYKVDSPSFQHWSKRVAEPMDLVEHGIDDCYSDYSGQNPSSTCIHRPHPFECTCSFCDKGFAQRLYRSLKKKCKDDIIGRELIDADTGKVVDKRSRHRPARTYELLLRKDRFESWNGPWNGKTY